MNFSRPNFPALLVLILLLYACKEDEKTTNKFSDPTLVKIADLQDRRHADSLDSFLNNENPHYRQEAVSAFASLQHAPDVNRIGMLLLKDPDKGVRRSAAFALGQIDDPSVERILLDALAKEKDPQIIAEILNAYGKATNHWRLDHAMFIEDSVKSAGLAWSLYRAGLRGKTDTLANEVAMRLLESTRSKESRLAAAHYFARGAKDFSKAEVILVRAAATDKAADVRMAAVLGLGKISSDTALTTLKRVIKDDEDSRVIVNAIRALANFPYRLIKHYLYEGLQHREVNVGVAASEVIIEKVPEEDWIEVSSLTNQVQYSRIRANLYEGALKAGQNKDLAAEIRSVYKKASDPYERAAYLAAFKSYPQAHGFVEQELRLADSAVMRSTAASTLVAMNKAENFPPSLKVRFAMLFKDLMTTEDDPAVLGTIASAVADTTLDHKSFLRDAGFLRAAKAKLRLPEHNESLQSIEAAIDYIEGRKQNTGISNEFNHPIDWDLVRKIPEDQLAIIKTRRGSLVLRLLVNESPGSVANFISLAQKDYFDNKPIHRVVPNFVIQGGCNRGDGWGSEDYSIRSEFSLRRYTTGSVGMASAGKDTEGTQWFITYSPTPHLDGRYTIFAEVIQGLGVLDYIQVGDKVMDVVIENFTAQ